MAKIWKALGVLVASVSLAQGEEEWVSLFDGETLKGWTNSQGDEVKEGNWVAEDGVLHRKGRGGDLYTAKEYGDFEFRWEWKISAEGNSGVKYRVTEYGSAKLGSEYQVLDDVHPDGQKSIKRQASALYDLVAPNEAKSLKPVGEWNSARVVAKGKHLQHYLNGQLVMDIVVGSEEWGKVLKQSKFSGKPDFAANKSGFIFLQDHNDEVWYRRLEIKVLK